MALAGEIQRQAVMIGYLNAFYLFSIVSFAIIPFILFARWEGHAK